MIAICDDDNQFLRQLKSKLLRHQQEQDTFVFFDSGTRLLDHLERQGYCFDLIFLDVQMPGLNGLETGREVKALAPHALIVMLTRYPGYALESFGIRPFDYLLKPVDMRRLIRVMDDARQVLVGGERFTFQSGYRRITLPLRTVRYIESHKWLMVVHYGERVYHINARMKALAEQLAPKGFMRVHNSFLVNTAHVIAVDRQVRTVTLASGEVIPVSAPKLAEVMALTSPEGRAGL